MSMFALASDILSIFFCTSLPRRNLFKKTRSSDCELPHDKVSKHRSRSRSRSWVRNERDNENERRPTNRYRPPRNLRSSDAESSPNKKSSPVKSVTPKSGSHKALAQKSWADLIEDGDEDQLWQELNPESLDFNDQKKNTEAEVKESEVSTPRSTGRKMTVEELLDTPSASSHSDQCFKAPASSSRTGRSGRNSGRHSGFGGRTGAHSRNERRPAEMETQVDILKRRQKDVDYGKNTIGYQNYLDLVPKEKRSAGMPVTPDKFQKIARRSWDSLIKRWRIKLHGYDPADGEDQEVELSDILSDMSFESKITFGDFSSPVSSAFPPSSPVSFLTFDEVPPLSSEGNLTDPDYDPVQDKDAPDDLIADMDEADFLS